MSDLPRTYIRISHQRFLDRFWPKPPPDSVQHKSQQLCSSCPLHFLFALQVIVGGLDGRASATQFAQAIHEHNVAQGFVLDISAEVIGDYDRWGYMERADDARPLWARPQVIFRFCEEDPFIVLDSWEDLEYEEVDPAYCQEVRDEIATLVTERFAVRFITAVYVVIVSGCGIRLSRWDPSGTVFSRPLNYAHNPNTFSEIFWRISMLTDDQLGLDPTAVPVLPDSDEYKLMNRLAEPREDDYPLVQGAVVEGDHANSGRMFQFHRARYANYVHNASGPWANVDARWKLSVPLADGSSRHFLVAGAMQYQKGPNPDRRNGRTYFAVDCLTEKVVFLKDTWRHADSIEREGQVLAALNAADVPHVPKLLCEADLIGQGTRTPEFHSEHNEAHRCDTSAHVGDATGSESDADDDVYESDPTGDAIVTLKHYRLVIADMCASIYRTCKSGRQIVAALRDCIYGHSQAIELAGWIHGDISLTNTMVYPYIEVSETGKATVQWKGVLIDWELSRPVDIPDTSVPYLQAKQRTWEFVSFKYCSDPFIGLSVEGDLESFFYVLLHHAIAYLFNNVEDTEDYLEKFFRVTYVPPDTTVISRHRTKTLYYGILTTHASTTTPLVFRGCNADGGEVARTPLNGLLNSLLCLSHASFVLYRLGRQVKIAPRPPMTGSFYDPGRHNSQPEEGESVLASDIASKSRDHVTVLELFDDALKEAWPLDDWAYSPPGVGQSQAEQAVEDSAEDWQGSNDSSSNSVSEQPAEVSLPAKVFEQKDLNIPQVEEQVKQEDIDSGSGKRRRSPSPARSKPDQAQEDAEKRFLERPLFKRLRDEYLPSFKIRS